MNDELDFDLAPDIYTLIDEDGVEQQFELLDVMEIDGNRYFALLPFFDDPAETLDTDGSLVVLRGETVDGEEMMASIDDDDEYERIGNLFLEKLANIYEDELDEINRNLQ